MLKQFDCLNSHGWELAPYYITGFNTITFDVDKSSANLLGRLPMIHFTSCLWIVYYPKKEAPRRAQPSNSRNQHNCMIPRTQWLSFEFVTKLHWKKKASRISHDQNFKQTLSWQEDKYKWVAATKAIESITYGNEYKLIKIAVFDLCLSNHWFSCEFMKFD